MMTHPKNGSRISTESKKIAALDGIASPVADICSTCREGSINTTVVVAADETALTSDDVAEEQLCVDSLIDGTLDEIRGEVRRQQRCAHSSLSELTVIGDKEKMRTISPER